MSNTHRMLLLLDILLRSILERPAYDVCLRARTLHFLRLLERAKEGWKIGELDQVPDLGDGCIDDG